MLAGARILVTIGPDKTAASTIRNSLGTRGCRVTKVDSLSNLLDDTSTIGLFDAAIIEPTTGLDRKAIELVRRLRAMHPPCASIFVVGAASTECCAAAIAAGVHLVLRKPIVGEHFLSAVQDAIDQSASWRQTLVENQLAPRHGSRVPWFIEGGPSIELGEAANDPAIEGVGDIPRLLDLSYCQSALARAGRLSVRERDVLGPLLMGLRNDEIAASLDITTRTVRFHVGNILEKLRVSSRSGLIGRLFVESPSDRPPRRSKKNRRAPSNGASKSSREARVAEIIARPPTAS